MTRVTQFHLYDSFLRDLQSVTSRMSRSQSELTSGQRIQKPSDDPFGTAQVLSFDAQLADVRQYQRNVSDALGQLGATDGALDGVTQALQRVRTLVVQASNGTLSQSDLNSVAAEVSQLKEAIRDQANSRYGSQYLFSGTATGTAPYAASDLSLGNSTAIDRRVAPGLQVTINVTGADVFDDTTGPLGIGVLDLMDDIVTNLQTGSPASLQALRSGNLSELDFHMDNVLEQRSRVGTTIARLEVNEQQLASLEERLMTARSELADVDAAKAYVEFQSLSTMYESALAAGSRIMQTTILDFL